MFGAYPQKSSRKRSSESSPEIRERIWYSEEIDSMDIVTALKERGVRNVRLNLDQRFIDFPMEVRKAIESILDDITPDDPPSIH